MEVATGSPLLVALGGMDGLENCTVITAKQHEGLIENVRYLAQIAAVAKVLLERYDEDGNMLNDEILKDLRLAIDGRRLQ